MFGCYNLFDDLDTGVRGTGLKLPAEQYDIPIFFHDALFDSTCQTVFDLFNLDGILGDRFLANGAIQPYLNVEKRRYRFRLYAPGPSRWWEWSLWDGTNFLPFWQICTDGNLLPNAVQVTSVRIAVAERVDIIVDFSKIKASRIYFVNRAEQVNGRGPTGKTLSPGTPVLQVNLTGAAVTNDESADPSVGAVGNVGMKLRDLPDMDFAALQAKAAKAEAPHLAVRARQRRLDGERQVLRRERRRCRRSRWVGRGLDHPEPRRLLASPGAHPLRRASDADAQRRTGEAEHAAQRRDRLRPPRRDQPADQRRNPSVHALPRHEGTLRDALPQRGA